MSKFAKLIRNCNKKKVAIGLSSVMVLGASGFIAEHAYASSHANDIFIEQQIKPDNKQCTKENEQIEKAENKQSEENQKDTISKSDEKQKDNINKSNEEQKDSKPEQQKESIKQDQPKKDKSTNAKEVKEAKQVNTVKKEKSQAEIEKEKQAQKADQERIAKEKEQKAQAMNSIYNHPCTNVSLGDRQLPDFDANRSVRVTPAIRELTKQVVGSETNPERQARKIYNWITNNIHYSNAYSAEVSKNQSYGTKSYADVVLANRSTICVGYSTLFSSMCSVVGLPTKIIIGNYHSDSGAWNCHSWNKVLVNGRWIKVDPTIGRLYNCFGTGGFDNRHQEQGTFLSLN